NPMQQESAIHSHAEKIGGLDGIPVDARDRANQGRFAEDRSEVETRVAQLKADGDDHGPKYDALEDRLKGLDAINEPLTQDADSSQLTSNPPGLPSDGNGRAIPATGNPDTADNVVTSVPGTTADLDGIGGNLEHSESILKRASERSPDTETAAVTWLGYDAPPDVTEATKTGYADDAVDDLRNFQDGLRETHQNGESIKE